MGVIRGANRIWNCSLASLVRAIPWTVVALTAFVTGWPSVAAASTGTFTSAPAMDIARGSSGTATLSNGDVLVTGGYDSAAHVVTNTAELYDPTTNSWADTGSMTTPRALFKMTTLANGEVLADGGVSSGSPGSGDAVFNSSAEIYNPSTAQWSAVAAMNTPRADMDQHLLGNGEVLTCGGVTSNTNVMTDTCEIFNSTNNSWTYTGSLPVTSGVGVPGDPMIEFTSGPLDGQFLVAGGFTDGQIPVGDAELYDPTTGKWTATGSMNSLRGGFTTTTLDDGYVLAAGGAQTGGTLTITDTAELYDPSGGTWAYTGSMNQERSRQTATLLSDGTVLVTGGYGGGQIPTDTAEIYDPDSSSWSYTGSLSLAVSNSEAVTLNTGQVLIIGGIETSTSTPVDNAWLYGGPSLSTSELSFDATDVATVSAARRVSFSNRGPRKVWLTARLTGSGRRQFALDASRCRKSLRPGGRCALKVCLAPRRAGSFVGRLQVVVRGHATLSVLLKGRARHVGASRRRPASILDGDQDSLQVRARGPDDFRYPCD
jgi:N-acetylneuraminic acid mutarotase